MPVSSVSRSYAAPFARRRTGGNREWIRVPPFTRRPRNSRLSFRAVAQGDENNGASLSLFAFLAVTQLSRLPILDGLEQEGTVSGILNVMKCNNGRI